MIKRVALSLAVLLSACSPPAQQAPGGAEGGGSEGGGSEGGGPVEGEAPAGAGMMMAAASTITATLTGPSTRLDATLNAEECAISEDGATGTVRASGDGDAGDGDSGDGDSEDGDFTLTWAGGAWRLVWRSTQGAYDGAVSGDVEGATVTFEGSSGGFSVSGAALCI